MNSWDVRMRKLFKDKLLAAPIGDSQWVIWSSESGKDVVDGIPEEAMTFRTVEHFENAIALVSKPTEYGVAWYEESFQVWATLTVDIENSELVFKSYDSERPSVGPGVIYIGGNRDESVMTPDGGEWVGAAIYPGFFELPVVLWEIFELDISGWDLRRVYRAYKKYKRFEGRVALSEPAVTTRGMPLRAI
ncbi:hypothetical protein ACFLWX_02710 [Chloroflexota bacterium]